MKKRFIIPSILLGALAALPAYAQPVMFDPETAPKGTYTIDDAIVETAVTGTNYGAILNGPRGAGSAYVTVYRKDGAYEYMSNVGGFGSTYNVNKNITINASTTGDTIAVDTADYKGIFNLQDITIDGGASTVGVGTLGFNLAFPSGNPTENVAFTGQINGGNITVNEKHSDAYAWANGVQIYNRDGATNSFMDIAGSVKFNDIKVNGVGVTSGLTGIAMGDVLEGGSVNVNLIDVKGDSNSTGVMMGTQAVAEGKAKGTLTVGKLDVEGDNSANGILLVDNTDDYNLQDSDVNMTLGEVDVVSSGGNATGITGKALSNITLTDNVTVTGNSGAAIGVNATSADLTIDGIVKVSAANGAFQTTGVGAEDALTVTLTKGSILDTTDGGVKSATDVNVTGGVVNSGIIEAGGAVNATNTLINISDTDLTNSTFGGNEINLNNAKINVADEDESLTSIPASIATIDFTNNGNSGVYVNTVHEVVFDKTTGLATGIVAAKSAPITAGYVQAMRMHHNYTTWNAVSSHMLSNFGVGAGYRGQECDPCDPVCDLDPCDPCDPCGSNISLGASLARTAWVNYVARSNTYDDITAGEWKYSAEGIQTGTDLYRTKRAQLGMLFGYEGGRMRNLGLSRVESENMYVGLYGTRIFRNGWDVRGSFSYGWQDYDMGRLDADTNTYLSSFKGHTTETNIEFGKRLAWRGAWSLRPVIGLDVYTNNTKAASEVAADGTPTTIGRMDYAKNSLTQAFIRTGAELNWQRKRIGFNSGLFYSYDFNGEELGGTVSNAHGSAGLSGSALGRELLSWNVGANFAVAKNLDIFGGYRGESLLDDGDGDGVMNMGYVGASWKW